MSQNVSFGELVSIAKRSQIGTRVLKAGLQSKLTKEDGTIQWVWNALTRFGYWLIEPGLQFWGARIVDAVNLFWSIQQAISHFNWNASDEELDQQINASITSLSARLGGFLGKSAGYLIAGGGSIAAIWVFNESLGSYLLKEAAPELIDELVTDFAALARLTAQQAINIAGINLFKQGRRFIKWYAEFYNGYIPSEVSDAIRNWGKKGSQPWSFSGQLENFIEAIPDGALKAGVEEFNDEFWDALREASYVIAQGADAWIAQQQLSNTVANPLGQMRYVEITPNRANPDEKIILAGDEELLQQQITATIAEAQVLADKDVGVVYNSNPNQQLAERRYKPHLLLKFKETKEDMYARGDSRELEGEISLRLMRWESETITKQYLTDLATLIKAKFGTPRYIWEKGNIQYNYEDERNGAQFKVLVENESMARNIIEKVLDLINVSPDWDKLKLGSKNVVPQTTPEKITILGKVEEQPVRGKKGKVRFLSADVSLYGKGNKIIHLYHAYGRYTDAYAK